MLLLLHIMLLWRLLLRRQMLRCMMVQGLRWHRMMLLLRHHPRPRLLLHVHGPLWRVHVVRVRIGLRRARIRRHIVRTRLLRHVVRCVVVHVLLLLLLRRRHSGRACERRHPRTRRLHRLGHVRLRRSAVVKAHHPQIVATVTTKIGAAADGFVRCRRLLRARVSPVQEAISTSIQSVITIEAEGVRGSATSVYISRYISMHGCMHAW